ncbi:MAG TPA: fructose-bisphosphatase class III [Lachnospiraceae bacterium]|nr:fructose-bisphosphatase class III [Lachnospiraceae bacterium]HPF29757.1 fructose-bisphosphatase class III [Lachnospiraceae bacterium]
MSTYVLSDIHGQYNAYMKMLDQIHFSKKDFLYVLGDVIDRGPDGIRIIQDIMTKKNAELIMGNHEFMLLNAIDYLRDRENGIDEARKNSDGLNPFELWIHPCNGGEGTCLEFLSLPVEVQNSLRDYLRTLYLIKRIKIGTKTYHLSHSYSLKKPFGKELSFAKATAEQTEEIVWESLFDKNKSIFWTEKPFAYVKDIYVFGHIFTQRVGQMNEKGKGYIYKSDDYRGYKIIDVDCGMALNGRSSQLGCICLETGEEYYVPLLED